MTLIGSFCASPNDSLLAWTPDGIFYAGRQIGVYVDDEVPDQAGVIGGLIGTWLVVGGVPQGNPATRFPGAIAALEWYPFWKGSVYLPPPPAMAYILQKTFAWPGSKPPTAAQQAQLLKDALSHSPALVLWY